MGTNRRQTKTRNEALEEGWLEAHKSTWLALPVMCEEDKERLYMIYAVTEWYEDHADRFFFDASKVDKNNPFESSYLSALQRAAARTDRALDLTQDPSIMDRFGDYQNGTEGWKRLTTTPPCWVDVEVQLVMDE